MVSSHFSTIWYEHLIPRSLLRGSSFSRTGKVEPRPIGGNTQAKEIEEMSKLVEGDAKSFKIGTSEIAERIATAGASESSVAPPKFPLHTLGRLFFHPI